MTQTFVSNNSDVLCNQPNEDCIEMEFMQVWEVNLFEAKRHCLIKMRSGCIKSCRVVEMTVYAFLFIPGLFCFSVHSPFTLGHAPPKPSTLTHHGDNPIFCACFKGNTMQEQEIWHTIVQIKPALTLFSF